MKHPETKSVDMSTIVSSDSRPCDPHPVIYEQITGPLVRSVALKTEGAAAPSGIDAQGWRWRRLCSLPILNSCMKDRCGFLFVRYKRHCCAELVSWEHAACPLSGIKKRPLVGGWLNTSSVVISFGATASVRYREVVRSWEGPLLEVPLYNISSKISKQCFVSTFY